MASLSVTFVVAYALAIFCGCLGTQEPSGEGSNSDSTLTGLGGSVGGSYSGRGAYPTYRQYVVKGGKSFASGHTGDPLYNQKHAQAAIVKSVFDLMNAITEAGRLFRNQLQQYGLTGFQWQFPMTGYQGQYGISGYQGQYSQTGYQPTFGGLFGTNKCGYMPSECGNIRKGVVTAPKYTFDFTMKRCVRRDVCSPCTVLNGPRFNVFNTLVDCNKSCH